MENLLFLGVPILKHIRVFLHKYVLYPLHMFQIFCAIYFSEYLPKTSSQLCNDIQYNIKIL